MGYLKAAGRDFASEAVRLDRDAFAIGYALRNALGMLLALALGVAVGAGEWAMYAAIGALVAGFADIGSTRANRTRTMLVCSLVATVSAFVGALAANADISAAVAIAIWGAAGGLLMVLGPAATMNGKLAVLSLILIGADPSSPGHALEIGVAILAGCLLQTLLVVLIPAAPAASAGAAVDAGRRWRAVKSVASYDQIIGRHAIRLALALTAGLVLYRSTSIGHGLWIPLTILFVLQPDPAQTNHKVFDRLIGTLAGVVLITLLVAVLKPGDVAMGLLACAFAVPTYAFFRANYALFSCSVAACVVLLTAINGLPESDAAFYRAVDTLIGGAIAMAVVLLIPLPPTRVDPATASPR